MSSNEQIRFSEVQSAIEIELSQFLAHQSQYLISIAPELSSVAQSLSTFLLDAGKRLRPLFAYSGFIGAGGKIYPEVIRAVASLELLQACALIHDDLMDGSDTRRGKPSIHRYFESLHQDAQMAGLSSRYGQAAAVLIGDLALVWSDQMLHSSGLSSAQLLSVLPVHDEMRVELMAGQFLDIHEQTQKSTSVVRSLNIARFKSGKYTIQRPLHIGSAIAITDKKLRVRINELYSNYGLPLGEAFQLRDDILGTFGDSQLTGKPAGDDLREGKRTVLIAKAYEKATASELRELNRYFGKIELELPGVEKLQSIITSTGARAYVEDLIESLTSNALEALNHDEIADNGAALLRELAQLATHRSK